MIKGNLGVNVIVTSPAPPVIPALVGYLTANPSSGIAPLAVTCRVLITGGAIDPESMLTFHWGDGSESISDIPFAMHTYLNAGTFTITVDVNGTDAKAHILSGVMEVQ